MEKIQKLIEKYGGDVKKKLKEPIFFINEIVGFESSVDSRLISYQEEWLELIENNTRLNLECFRSGGKTETILINYPIFKAFTQPGWQGILVSNSLKQSVSILRRIRNKIIDNDVLRTSIPAGRTGLWSKTELQLKNGSMIWSRPNNENLPGEHVDFIGGDEIGYWKNMDIITKVIPPMVLAKGGKVVFVGTPTSQIDAIHQLKKNKSYLSRSYPATARDPSSGKYLLELRYPNRKISDIKREYDSLSWSREFLLKPLGAKDRIYPYDLISKSFDYDSPFSLTRKNGVSYYMGLDFALSGEAGSDFTVYTILEKKDDVCRLVNMERYKGLTYQAQKSRIKTLSDIYKPIKVVADEGSFGKSFIEDLIVDFVPVEGFRFTNQSKQDLHTNLRNMFEQDRIIINKDAEDIKTKTITDALIKELSDFGVIWDEQKLTVRFEGLGEHDDMVTSFALASWGARGSGSMSWFVARGAPKGSGNLFYLGKVH